MFVTGITHWGYGGGVMRSLIVVRSGQVGHMSVRHVRGVRDTPRAGFGVREKHETALTNRLVSVLWSHMFIIIIIITITIIMINIYY